VMFAAMNPGNLTNGNGLLVVDVVAKTVKRVRVHAANSNGKKFGFLFQVKVAGDFVYLGGAHSDDPEVMNDPSLEDPAIYKLAMEGVLKTGQDEVVDSRYLSRVPDPNNVLTFTPSPPPLFPQYATFYGIWTVGNYIHFKGFNFLNGNPGIPPDKHARLSLADDSLEAMPDMKAGVVTKPFEFQGGMAAFHMLMDYQFTPQRPPWLRIYPDATDMDTFTDIETGVFGYTGYELDEDHIIAVGGGNQHDFSVILRINATAGTAVQVHDYGTSMKKIDGFRQLFWKPPPSKLFWAGFNDYTDKFSNIFTYVSGNKISRLFNDGHYVEASLSH